MRFYDLRAGESIRELPSPSLLCVGSFDGVHLGHRQLVERTLDLVTMRRAVDPSTVGGVWLLDSSAYKGCEQLCTLDERLALFAELGLEYAVVADFSEVRDLSPEEFVHGILMGQCRCVGAVCGENFRFGKNASAGAAELSHLMDGQVDVVPLLSVGGETVSSTRIRELLLSGDIERANTLLGSHYSICETVVHGKHLGHTLGIPTANQYPTAKTLLLPSGVYSTVCTVDGKRYLGVTDVGIRPTTDVRGVKRAETYLISYSGDCYGKTVKVEFLERLRDEIKFSGLDELVAQIRRDIDSTKNNFEI